MRIVIHIGPMGTGGTALKKQLTSNADLLRDAGVFVRVSDGDFRHLKEAITQNRSVEELLDALKTPDDAKTLVLCNETQVGTPDRPFGKRFWYGRARGRVLPIHEYFDGMDVWTSVALRNPATLIPAKYALTLSQRNYLSFSDFIGQTPLDQLSWAEFLERLQLLDAYKPIMTWRYEDYPYIWRDVVQALTGLENAQTLNGEVPQAEAEFSIAQLSHYANQVAELKDKGEAIPKDHWNTFETTADSITKLPEHPSWTSQFEETLTEIYDEDLYSAARMEGVHLIERRRLP